MFFLGIQPSLQSFIIFWYFLSLEVPKENRNARDIIVNKEVPRRLESVLFRFEIVVMALTSKRIYKLRYKKAIRKKNGILKRFFVGYFLDYRFNFDFFRVLVFQFH